MTSTVRLACAALFLALAITGCDGGKEDDGDPTPTGTPFIAFPQDSLVTRGKYLVEIGGCGSCHTPILPNGDIDTTRILAGRDCFIDLPNGGPPDPGDGFGCLSSSNLTSHATGLGNTTDAAILAALTDGIR